MNKTLALTFFAAGVSLAPQAYAAPGDFAVGAGIGTAGLEAQAAYAVSDFVVVRGAANWLDFSRSEAFDDINYDMDVGLSTIALGLDLHPFRNAFVLSGGAYFGDRKADVVGAPTTNVTIGGTTYTPAQAGRITGTLDLGDVAPFAGLGFDSTFTSTSAWGFRAMAGIVFGDVSATLRSSNPAVTAADLAREQANIENDAGVLESYPLVSVGVNYRF